MSTLLTAPAERTATMVKHTITNCRAVLRRDQRAFLGRLRDRIINSKTQLRYERAVTRFSLRFTGLDVQARGAPIRGFDPLHFDSALYSFIIESLWEEGDSKNEAIDCVSGVLHYLPQLKGKVPGGKSELPTRAPPLNTFFLAALAGKAVALNDRRPRCFFVVGVSLYATHRRTAQNSQDGSLPHGPALPRHRCAARNQIWAAYRSSETVVIFDAYLVRMLAIVCRDLAPADFLVGCLPPHFGPSLLDSCTRLGSQSAAGNLTASGAVEATTDFLHHGQLDRTMVRGRWASAKTAPLYIDDAVSMQAQPVVTNQQNCTMAKWAAWVPFS